MRIVMLASGAFAEPTIRWLADSNYEIPLLITQPARGSGRGLRATPTPARHAAEEHGIQVLEVENVNTAEIIGAVRELDARVMLVIAFGQKLGPEFLSASPGGAINLHASLLPYYRGAAPINWAIVRGETQSGCTVFRIVQRMDAGPILAQDALDIEPNETAGALHDRLAQVGVETVKRALVQFENSEDPHGVAQDESLVTLAPKLKKTDGWVNFWGDGRTVLNHIRGMTPWPGATAFLKTAQQSHQMTILSAERTDVLAGGLTPGTLDSSYRVATADRLIQILEVQPAGGRAMAWRDFINGRRVVSGDRFEVSADPA